MQRFPRRHQDYFHNGEERSVYTLYIINMGILCRNDVAAILYASRDLASRSDRSHHFIRISNTRSCSTSSRWNGSLSLHRNTFIKRILRHLRSSSGFVRHDKSHKSDDILSHHRRYFLCHYVLYGQKETD